MSDRESLDVDVLVIGGGPAGLAAALKARQLLTAAGRDDAMVLLLEKGREIGHHILSGCVMDPRALTELIPDWRAQGAPIESDVTSEAVYFLTKRWKIRLPAPPPLRNHGNVVCSLGELCRWLAGRCEAAGVEVMPAFPAAELLFEGDRVTGVRVADKGIGKRGEPKGSYEPGMEIRAKVTILAEGSRGSCTKVLVERLGLAGHNPATYSTGAKEIWKVPSGRYPAGRVVHTMGHPLDRHTYGGSFVYGMAADHVAVGFVVGLDYLNPYTDAHRALQEWKLHPWMMRLLAGAELVCYGAKTIPIGGFWSMPRLYADGVLIAGDSGGFLNSARLKGVHLAIKSGAMAAETAVEALDEPSAARLAAYERRFRESWAWRELRRVRNFHQGFQKGLWRGLFHAAAQQVTRGRGLWRDPMPAGPDHQRMLTREAYTARFGHAPARPARKWDGTLTFDKLGDLFTSGTKHEEDQPVHLHVSDPTVCVTRCATEYGHPCEHFCPAAVYEIVTNDAGGKRLQINAGNCVHCKTCDIMDPYAMITWVTPEGGGGPGYARM